jgi:hypothetical protein
MNTRGTLGTLLGTPSQIEGGVTAGSTPRLTPGLVTRDPNRPNSEPNVPSVDIWPHLARIDPPMASKRIAY